MFTHRHTPCIHATVWIFRFCVFHSLNWVQMIFVQTGNQIFCQFLVCTLLLLRGWVDWFQPSAGVKPDSRSAFHPLPLALANRVVDHQPWKDTLSPFLTNPSNLNSFSKKTFSFLFWQVMMSRTVYRPGFFGSWPKSSTISRTKNGICPKSADLVLWLFQLVFNRLAILNVDWI